MAAAVLNQSWGPYCSAAGDYTFSGEWSGFSYNADRREKQLLSATGSPLSATFTSLQYTLIEFLFRDREAQTAHGIQFTTPPHQRLDPSPLLLLQEKRTCFLATKGNLQIPYLSLFPLSASLFSRSLSMSVIISFQWILTRKWAYLNGKISFSFRRWFSVFKAHGKDRQTVSSRSSKAMMLSAVSCNTDEWRERNGGWRDATGGWRDGGDSGEKSIQQGEGCEKKRPHRKRKNG